MSVAERREAVKQLTGEGHSNREIASIVRMKESTVRNDKNAQSCAPIGKNFSSNNGHEVEDAQNCAPLDA
jgi:hypothetical protein